MDENRRKNRATLGLIAFGVTLFVGLWHLSSVLNVLGILLGMVSFFIIGLSIAFILNTPMQLIENRLFAPLNRRYKRLWPHIRRPAAVVATILMLLAVLATVVFMVIPEMVRTVKIITDEIPGFIQNVDAWLEEMGIKGGEVPAALRLDQVDWTKLGETVLDLLRNGAGSFVTGTVSAATSIASGVFNFVVGIILAIYVLLSKEKLHGQVKRLLYAYLPEARVDRVLAIGSTANRIFSSFITGQFFEAVILGVLCFLGMTIFGFPFAPMVSVLVCVTAFIPIFGAFIGLGVGAFMILVNQGLLQTAWFVLFFIVLQQIEGNLIYPHVVGKSVMLPGLWVLVAVTVGGNLFGIVGMLVSVPLASLLYTLLREAVNARNKASGVPKRKLTT